MMEKAGSGNVSIPGSSAHTVTAFDFDLNKTPPPSPPKQPERLPGNDDGPTADHRCASCGRKEGEMVVCSVCVRLFHVECLGGSEEERYWKCAECSTECRNSKRLRRSSSEVSGCTGLGLIDVNASPPREVDDDHMEVCVNPELASTNRALEYDLLSLLDNIRLDDEYA